MKTEKAPTVTRTRNARPLSDEKCPCGKGPAWVKVEIYDDGSEVRVPVCGIWP